MMKIIKRGGFREQAARQLKYKNSVNQRAEVKAQKTYQPAEPKQQEAKAADQVDTVTKA